VLEVKRISAAFAAAILVITVAAQSAAAQQQSILIFAAASMKNALDDVNAAFTKGGGTRSLPATPRARH